MHDSVTNVAFTKCDVLFRTPTLPKLAMRARGESLKSRLWLDMAPTRPFPSPVFMSSSLLSSWSPENTVVT